MNRIMNISFTTRIVLLQKLKYVFRLENLTRYVRWVKTGLHQLELSTRT